MYTYLLRQMIRADVEGCDFVFAFVVEVEVEVDASDAGAIVL